LSFKIDVNWQISCFSLFIFSSFFSCTDSTDSHRSCVSVLPLNFASKDVQDSTLLSDTLIEQDYMTEILSKMEENR
jgi:hypothetical protein